MEAAGSQLQWLGGATAWRGEGRGPASHNNTNNTQSSNANGNKTNVIFFVRSIRNFRWQENDQVFLPRRLISGSGATPCLYEVDSKFWLHQGFSARRPANCEERRGPGAGPGGGAGAGAGLWFRYKGTMMIMPICSRLCKCKCKSKH